MDLSAQAVPSRCIAQIHRPTGEPWQLIRNDIVRLEYEAFGDGAFDEEYLAEEFANPESVVVILRDPVGNSVIGFTYALPINMVEEGRDDERDETAHVGDTIVGEAYRGHGLVGVMMRVLEDELRRRGYRFLEREAAVANKYAATIARAYTGRIISQSEQHDSPWGPQVHFRIHL